MDNIEVNVIIPNWNGAKFLHDCLSSLRDQTYQNMEIIMVDNGSADNSINFAKENFPEVRIVSLNKNMGFAYAVNKGISSSKGKYIALLNNDTKVEKNWLEELVKVLNENPEAGSGTPKIMMIDNKKIIGGTGDFYNSFGLTFQRGHGEIDRGQYDKREEVFSACGTASIYRKEIFDNIGLFDEDFFSYFEDVDLGFRAQLAGWKCIYVPTAIVYHHYRGTSENISSFDFYYTPRNRIFLMIKNMPLNLILRKIHKLIYAQLSIAIYFLTEKQLLNLLKAYLGVLRKLPSMLKKRKKILNQKKVSSQYLNSLIDEK